MSGNQFAGCFQPRESALCTCAGLDATDSGEFCGLRLPVPVREKTPCVLVGDEPSGRRADFFEHLFTKKECPSSIYRRVVRGGIIPGHEMPHARFEQRPPFTGEHRSRVEEVVCPCVPGESAGAGGVLSQCEKKVGVPQAQRPAEARVHSRAKRSNSISCRLASRRLSASGVALRRRSSCSRPPSSGGISSRRKLRFCVARRKSASKASLTRADSALPVDPGLHVILPIPNAPPSSCRLILDR